ncbi:DUF3179 domain-containing protein [Patescibacteria group bacterium]|nr:DUF3179 domain-containing protein [Patescibacteria group bacterium]MBU1705347.1 DUF3179 domain-containing protein [Patescibacteria group bacterium]
MRSRGIYYFIFSVLIVGGIFAYQYWNFRIPRQLPIQEYDFSLRETDGVKHIVDLGDLVSAGAPQDNIPSIEAPEFESMPDADVYLKDDGYGLDLEIDGDHRFYPYQLMVWHEIVNDVFNGQPVLVTYCPLCESGVVFERRIGEQTVEFGTAGRLWNNNLVMYDRQTQTWWSQILGQGVVGELAGRDLQRLPAQVMTWDAWKRQYPDGEVLSRETGADRDYTRDPYGDYYTNSDIHFTLTGRDARLQVKERIYGVLTDAQSAYLRAAVVNEPVINDQIGGLSTVLVYNDETEAVRVFSRQINGQILTFSKNGQTLIDEQTQSQWSLDGLAISGDWQGATLEELPVISAFWFCWSAAYPNSNLHLP